MPATAPAILELGLVLLAAAACGWFSRRLGMPAVVGYLILGVAISPLTPGFVADREQLELLADVGVVLLLFEVGIEIDVVRLRREQRALLWAAPLQVAVTMMVGGVAFGLAGVPPVGAAILGLCLAFSSSVVVVNITRSRRRTTDQATEDAMLGWSVVQDITAIAVAAILLVLLGSDARPPEVALPLLVGFGVLAAVAAWLLPRVLLRHLRARPDDGHDRAGERQLGRRPGRRRQLRTR